VSTKKMQKTLDTVKGDVRELREAFWALRDEIMTRQAVQAAESQARPGSTPDPAPVTVASGDVSVGQIQVTGSYEMDQGDENPVLVRWTLADLTIDDALAVAVNEAAELLAAIGHRQRLAIVLLLLRAPATANEIVAALSLGTTGAAYHHLNVLQRTGLVQQAERGAFSLTTERIPVLLTILAGLSGEVVMTTEQRTLREDAASAPSEVYVTGESDQT
jgi:DNA-binding transcriptional ArsR family regulator